MTKEEAKKAAEVMLAYANGKPIEVLAHGSYVGVSVPNFNWGDTTYRVQETPQGKAFQTKEECIEEMSKHTPFGWLKSSVGNYKQIMQVRYSGITMVAEGGLCALDDFPFEYAFEEFKFLDGSPFGINEKVE